MPASLSSSITHSLDTLPQNILVVDSYEVIQFANSSWSAYNNEYGLSSNREWVGVNYFELFEELCGDPNIIVMLRESFHSIHRGERLICSVELPIVTLKKSSRVFRLDAFPLLSAPHPLSGRGTLIVSLSDVGPVMEDCHIQPVLFHRPSNKSACKLKLTPICASCKSIRNSKEEWGSIEHFLQQQLSMQFTHDICPACIRQLYPKYAGALKNQAGI